MCLRMLSEDRSLEEEFSLCLVVIVEVNGVKTNALRLEGDNSVDLLVGRVGSSGRSTNRWPGELVLFHLRVVLVVREGSLSDLHANLWLRWVLSGPNVKSVLMQVEHRGLSRGTVK